MVIDIERKKVKQLMKHIRYLVFMFLGFILFFIIVALAYALNNPGFSAIPLWIMTIFMSAGYFSVAIVFWWFLQQQVKNLRTDHHLQINPEDIVFQYGHQQIAIPWSDIVAVKKGMFQNSVITVKLDPESQYDRRVYNLQSIYELDQKRLYGEIEEAWLTGRDKLKT